MSKLTAPLENFFFNQKDLYAVSLFRVLFAIVMIVMYSTRFLELPLIYYNGGIMPADLAGQFMPPFLKPMFYWFPTSDSMVFTVMCAHMFMLVLFALGILGQFTTWILLFVHLSLIQRNYTAMYGADLVSTYFLFYLGFVQHNKYFSVIKYFKGRELSGIRNDMSSLGIRFIQIQLGVTYAFTGMEKLRGPSWWDGTALWKVIGNSSIVPFDFSFMSHFPLLIALGTYMTLIFELYFGFAVMVPVLRKPWLIVGGIFHLITAIIMGLPFFSAIMVASYLVFFTGPQLHKAMGRTRNLFNKYRVN